MIRRSEGSTFGFLALAATIPLAGCSQMRGRMAPELNAGNWINTTSNEGFNLADHRGETVLLEFWATW